MLPGAPKLLEELGISPELAIDLALRRLWLDGTSSLSALGRALRLSVPVTDQIFRRLRQQQLVEVKGMNGNDYQFVLTAAGRQQALDRMQASQYAGAVPVSLQAYQRMATNQTAKVQVNREVLRQAFSDLVVGDRLLDELGPALISQSSLFLYGGSGNGKTSIAERLLRVYRDTILIPHAIAVDNQIISLFDPVVHQPVRRAETSDAGELDQRWVECARPCVMAGGELAPAMLELRLDETTGIYAAPLQMKANNGIFIIDDFGRQIMSPSDLLNRWIVPLDRRVDYLSLRYGVKFQTPFELMVVFSTNLNPTQLADEAFLRRIRNKVEVEAVSDAAFARIYERELQRRSIPAAADTARYLAAICREKGGAELRACYPSDILNIVQAISAYQADAPAANEEILTRAAGLYFARLQG